MGIVTQGAEKEEHASPPNSGQHHPRNKSMAAYLILLTALVASVTADDASSAYAAPSGGYSAPGNNYAAPTGGYAPPSTGYGVSDSGYAAPETYQSTGYEAPSQSYGVVEENPFDLSKILELLPLFLAVFAAIIVAQLFAPLLGPLGAAKINLINFVLAPLGLAVCTTGPPLAIAGRSFDGRDLASEFSMNPDVVDNVAK